MATSPLFGWEEPDDTDLVKDGAAAIRTLGNAIDTSMGDLLGGTTGQVLSKNSNTNMDFTWVTSDDANAIQNTIVDAKGDLIAASASDTPARLAVGANDTRLVADSTAATGLAWKTSAASYPWTTWSPTYTNLTIGNGTVTARYQQIGKTINVYWKLVWGSTTSFTAYPLISYPATAAQGNYFMGTSYLLDNSASIVNTGLVYAELGKASFQPLTVLSNGTYTSSAFFTANTIPFTWTTNDEIICNFTYEAA